MNRTVTAVILAGGRAQRMGEVDKGLQQLGGRSLAQWVIDRIEPQVDEILISANRNLERYLEFGHPVLRDVLPGFAGPLAGLQVAMTQARTELVACVPCDTPLLPRDLVARLTDALSATGADVAVARTGTRTHSVFCVCSTSLHDNLAAFLASGQRKVSAWHETLKVCYVEFDDNRDSFRNINTLAELHALEWPQARHH